ncbi:MAG: uroporphyrinogen decarboxylase, partial [Actinomycetota bacterium]
MTGSPSNDRLLRALRRECVDRTPVWFMRQAGRYLPEYRELRGSTDILETCRRPDLVVELTLQPLRRMPLDAAILFSDIMVPMAAIGVPVRIESGRGPVLDEPIRDAGGVARLRGLDPEVDEPFVSEAIRLLVKELEVPLIGFSGAPFTLASYLIEGEPSRTFARTKALMHSDPAVFERLLAALTDVVVAHLRAQVDAGAHAVQLFDSWVGALDRDDYRRFVFPHTARVFERIADTGVPAIHSGVGTGHLLDLMRDAGGEDLGADHPVPLHGARGTTSSERATQGKPDPVVPFG